MHAGQIDTVLFVHGYSVTDLRSFNKLPSLLQADGIAPDHIFFAGFVSLDDRVSCEDLAAGLEARVAILESAPFGLDLSRTMLIAHSTGAIVARRWILNRRAKRAANPDFKTLSHFISCAGANHGSTMAQLGQTELAYVFRDITEGRSVGKRVLEDLDYGSAFLRQLNRDWLEAWNDSSAPVYADTFCFSMGGTDHSFWQNHLTWQSREFGSDGTVRISGANLNYRWITVSSAAPAGYVLETLAQPAPHLIVETPAKSYSHTSQSAPDTQNLVINAANAVDTIIHGFKGEADRLSSETYGIVEGVLSAAERPYVAIRQAMAAQDLVAYEALADAWATENGAWTAVNPDGANSTVVVAIGDGTRTMVDDSLVLLRDAGGTIGSVSSSILDNQPIRNGVTPSVASFYLNFNAFETSHPHSIHVEALTDTPYVSYGGTIDGALSGGSDHVIAANEFTYVDVTMDRNPAATIAFCQFSNPNFAALLAATFPPFAGEGWI